MSVEPFVKSAVESGVCTITFGHPSHNSLTSDMLSDLSDQLHRAGASEQVKVIVLQSQGDRTFSAGANLAQLAAVKDIREGHSFFLGFANVINAIRTCGKIVIGRVHGKAVGGGVGIIAACDLSMTTKWGLVRLSELSIGIAPLVIEPAITRKMGKAAFARMSLSPAEWHTAQWAFEQGLYQERFEKVEQMDDYLDRQLTQLTSHSHLALSAIKSALWHDTDHWQAHLHERARQSAILALDPHTQALLTRYSQA